MDVLPILSIRLKASKPDYTPYPDENDTSLGAVLKRKRLDLGLTQLQIAQQLKTSSSSYNAWERNVYQPDLKMKYKINEFLEVEFFKEENDLASEMLKFRVKHNLFQKDLGKRLGVSLRTIEKIEQRQGGVAEKTIKRIEKHIKAKFSFYNP